MVLYKTRGEIIMNVKKYSIQITIIIVLFCCREIVQSENAGFNEIQKRVISEDRLNIKDRESAIKHFEKINKYFTKPYNIKNGKFSDLYCTSSHITDDEFKYIVFFAELNSIGVTGKGITDKSLEYLQEHILITGLSFIKTNVTGKGIKHLKKLTKLGGLDFQDSPFTDEGCKYLSEIKFEEPISEANFSNTKITDEGLKYLSKIQFYGELK
jgi:hypothetical protein